MANTETIKLEEQEFKVFRRLPVPINRQIQIMLIEMSEDFEGSFEDLETGKIKAKDTKGLKLEVLHEIHDVLLTKCVLSPKITKEDIQNIEHDFQPYFQDLADKLFEKYTAEKSRIKKKSMN